ncbi:hypothetical protein OSB04_024629 [Centaurea solstitialis]|uniref:Uncharacterized protein n=1 Tax=Centaurea solstitialis TaxID=347529 RepID=A0AA38W3A0_9ASTR|nr:hypothetical protein OSB04_024629 [Centaurea solstitialis]
MGSEWTWDSKAERREKRVQVVQEFDAIERTIDHVSMGVFNNTIVEWDGRRDEFWGEIRSQVAFSASPGKPRDLTPRPEVTDKRCLVYLTLIYGDIIQGEYINPYTWLYVQIACDAYVVMRLACCVMAYPL